MGYTCMYMHVPSCETYPKRYSSTCTVSEPTRPITVGIQSIYGPRVYTQLQNIHIMSYTCIHPTCTVCEPTWLTAVGIQSLVYGLQYPHVPEQHTHRAIKWASDWFWLPQVPSHLGSARLHVHGACMHLCMFIKLQYCVCRKRRFLLNEVCGSIEEIDWNGFTGLKHCLLSIHVDKEQVHVHVHVHAGSVSKGQSNVYWTTAQQVMIQILIARTAQLKTFAVWAKILPNPTMYFPCIAEILCQRNTIIP